MFKKIADKTEKTCSHPVSLVAFLLWCAIMPFLSVDAANYGISVLTAFLLMLTLSGVRRDRLAIHAKLDELVTEIDQPRSEIAGIEELTEEEIAASRQSKELK